MTKAKVGDESLTRAWRIIERCWPSLRPRLRLLPPPDAELREDEDLCLREEDEPPPQGGSASCMPSTLLLRPFCACPLGLISTSSTVRLFPRALLASLPSCGNSLRLICGSSAACGSGDGRLAAVTNQEVKNALNLVVQEDLA